MISCANRGAKSKSTSYDSIIHRSINILFFLVKLPGKRRQINRNITCSFSLLLVWFHSDFSPLPTRIKVPPFQLQTGKRSITWALQFMLKKPPMEVKSQFKKKKNKQTNKQTRNDEEREVAEREAPKHDYLTLRAPLSISEIRFLV